MRPRLASAAAVVLGGALPVATSILPTDSTMATWMMLAVVGTTLAITAVDGPDRLPKPVWVTLVSAIIVFAIAAFAGVTPLLSLLGRPPRYDGVLTITGYGLAAVAGARLLGPSTPRARHDLFISSIAVAALINAGASLYQFATRAGRITAMLGNSSIAGSWAVIALAMLGWQWWDQRRRLWGLGAVAAGSVLVLAASRGAWLAAIVVLIALPLVPSASRFRLRWWVGPALAATLLAIAAVLPSTSARLVGDTTLSASTVTGRLLLWQDSISLALAHPLLGTGGSTFIDQIGAHHGPAWAAEVGPYAPPDSPHNVVLQLLTSSGVIGLIAALAFVFSVAWSLRLRLNWSCWTIASGCALVGVGISTMFTFTDPVTMTSAMILAGSITARPGRPPSRWQLSAFMIATGVWSAASLVQLGSALTGEASFGTAAASGNVHELAAVAKSRPGDPDLAVQIGRTIAATAQRREEAAVGVTVVGPACRQLSASSECALVLGDLQTLAGGPASAQATLRAALLHDPYNVDMVLKLGIAEAELHRYSPAEASFLRAAALRPSAPEAWDDLAKLYRIQGRGEDAARAAERADSLR